MKLSLQTDFTTLPRVAAVRSDSGGPAPFTSVSLEHDERHLRRKVLLLADGGKVLVDLPQAVSLADGDRLILEDGRAVLVEAASEPLLEIVPRDALHLAELCWHIGNRHLAAEIAPDRILLARDHVLRAMLEGLGAAVREVHAPFHPLRGAYGGHGHAH